MNTDLANLEYARKTSAKLQIRPPTGKEDVLVMPGGISRPVALIKPKTKWYFVMPDVDRELPESSTEFSSLALACVLPANTKSSESEPQFLLWPLKEKSSNANEVAEVASQMWCRIVWENRKYEVVEASMDHGPVKWPFATVNDAIQSAFKGRIIEGLDHPVIQQVLEEQSK